MRLWSSPAENLENVRFLNRLRGSNDRHDDEDMGAPRVEPPLQSCDVEGASRPARRAVRKLSERPGSCQRGLKCGRIWPRYGPESRVTDNRKSLTLPSIDEAVRIANSVALLLLSILTGRDQ